MFRSIPSSTPKEAPITKPSTPPFVEPWEGDGSYQLVDYLKGLPAECPQEQQTGQKPATPLRPLLARAMGALQRSVRPHRTPQRS